MQFDFVGQWNCVHTVTLGRSKTHHAQSDSSRPTQSCASFVYKSSNKQNLYGAYESNFAHMPLTRTI